MNLINCKRTSASLSLPATIILIACVFGSLPVQAAEPTPVPQNQGAQKTEDVLPGYRPEWEMSGPPGPMLSPADPNPIPAVDCVNHCPPGYEATWRAVGPVWGFQKPSL